MFGFYDKYFLLFGIPITYYGFLIAIAMLLGIMIACVLAKKRGLKSDDIFVLACYVIPLSVIGARLYWVLFSPKEITSFWQIFEIWEGGLAILGGVLGGVVAILLYCLIHKKNFFDVGDVVVPSLALGQFIGRIGCYFAGCCFGVEITNASHQWFPLGIQIGRTWHYSTFFFESFACLLIFFLLLFLLLRKVKTRGIVSSVYIMYYGIARCVIETFRGDSLYIGVVKVSQLLSGLMIILGVGLLIFFLVKGRQNFVNATNSTDKSANKNTNDDMHKNKAEEYQDLPSEEKTKSEEDKEIDKKK